MKPTYKIIQMIAFVIFTLSAETFAQVKVKNDGRTFIGDPTSDWGAELNVKTQNRQTFWTESSYSYDWGHNTGTNVNQSHTVSWVVMLNGAVKFYVEGNGQAVATNFYTSSDSTYKKNISKIANALDKVKALRGVNYNRKDEFFQELSDSILNTDIENKSKKEFGLIAQDVELVIPEVVAEDINGKKVVAYQNIIPLLIEAIKEQQIQIETLQSIAYSQEQDLMRTKEAIETCCSSKEEDAGLKSANIDGSVHKDDTNIIETAKLFDNIPNPFSQNTTIKFEIPANTRSSQIIIHNMQGVELKSFPINVEGPGYITVNGAEFYAGMYLYTLVIDNQIIDTKRMLLTKAQ